MIDALVEKARRLVKLKLFEISAVANPAQAGAAVMLRKALAGGNVPFVLVKADDKRQAFGIAMFATKNGRPFVDAQGDTIATDDLAEASYEFVKSGTAVAGDNHERVGVGRLIEAMTFTDEKVRALTAGLRKQGIDAQVKLPAEFLWVGFHIDDDRTWRAIKGGALTSWSIGGQAERVEFTKGDEEMNEAEIKKLIADSVAKALAPHVAALAHAQTTAALKQREAETVAKSDDVMKEVNDLAQSLVEKSAFKMTAEQARSKIWLNRPDLLRKYRSALYAEKRDPRSRAMGD